MNLHYLCFSILFHLLTVVYILGVSFSCGTQLGKKCLSWHFCGCFYSVSLSFSILVPSSDIELGPFTEEAGFF